MILVIIRSVAFSVSINCVDTGLSWKYYVTILKGGIGAMIPEKLCEGRPGPDKKGASRVAQ